MLEEIERRYLEIKAIEKKREIESMNEMSDFDLGVVASECQRCGNREKEMIARQILVGRGY